jgi:lysozyme family protein
MTDFFPAAVSIVLEAEGIFSNDPADPGGETYYGLSRIANPELEPWPPTKDRAIAVYRKKYWDAHRCGEMPWSWAISVFDAFVNQGNVTKLMQNVLGLRQDGILGDATIAAIEKAPVDLLNLFFAGRAFSYIANSNFPTFGKGWLKRTYAVRAAAAVTPSS